MPPIRQRLCALVDAAGLTTFRRLFGALLVAAVVRFAALGWISSIYIEPAYHFPYWGFAWLRPWPGIGMYIHFAALGLAATALAVGWRPRLAAGVCLVLFTYVELLDSATYLNHYYFVSIILFLLAVLPSPPTTGPARVPAWAYTCLRIQVGLVYWFAGVAKLGEDWLVYGQPLKLWLAAHRDLPVLGPVLAQPQTALAMSWAGAAFDLSIPWLLACPQTRVPAYIVLVGFHGLTGALFPIGMFPWFMIAAALIFFPPSWPRNLATRTRPPPAHAPTDGRWPGWPLRLVLGLHFAIQCALPLRHHLYPGDHRWTEEGLRWAWHVMLVEKIGVVTYRVHDPATGQDFRIHPEDLLTRQQATQMAFAPDLIVHFAHHLAGELAQQGRPGVEIRADVFVTYNGRPNARLVDPDIDLTQVEDSLAPKPWILPAPPRR